MFSWDQDKDGYPAACGTARAKTRVNECTSRKGFYSVVASDVAAGVYRDESSGLEQWLMFQSHSYNIQTVPKQAKVVLA